EGNHARDEFPRTPRRAAAANHLLDYCDCGWVFRLLGIRRQNCRVDAEADHGSVAAQWHAADAGLSEPHRPLQPLLEDRDAGGFVCSVSSCALSSVDVYFAGA